MHTKETPAGGPGMGMDLVTRYVSRLKCFTEWEVCQAELLMLAAIVSGVVLI